MVKTTRQIADTLGEVVVHEHIGRLQLLVIDRVVGSDQRQGRLMVKVCSLAAHLLMRLGSQLHRFLAAIAPLLAP
jgi:hypothetical protein